MGGRELSPDLPVTRYCLLGRFALDIFTMNGSLSVDCQAVGITNSSGLLRLGHMGD